MALHARNRSADLALTSAAGDEQAHSRVFVRKLSAFKPVPTVLGSPVKPDPTAGLPVRPDPTAGSPVRPDPTAGSPVKHDSTPESPSSAADDRRASHATFGSRSTNRHRRSSTFGGSGASSIGTDESRRLSIGSAGSASHKTPESDSAIDAHLIFSSSINAARIIPRALGPPSKGTPLEPLVVERVHAQAEPLGARQSKLDKVLGRGAETARVILEIERRADARTPSALETTCLPPPPTKRHQLSASHSALASVLTDRQRTLSLDSLTSLDPSLNESVNTLTNLLPPVPARSNAPELYSTHRTQLVKRARKLERVLGETLREAQVGEHIVEPASTLLDRHAWPSLSTGPEWDAQDVVPRRANESRQLGQTQSSLDPLANHKPSLGGRAVAALKKATRPEPDESAPDGLEIYVAREKVTVIKRDHTDSESHTVNRPRDVESAPVSPSSIMTTSSSILCEYDSEEEAKRSRRVRLAKLHRLLGTTIPPSLVPAVSRSSTPVGERPPLIPRQIGTSPASFMSFEDRPLHKLDRAHAHGWASKLMAASGMKPRPGSSRDHAGSFIDVGDRMTDKEKQVARKRANKLEYLFGTLPPHGMFVTSSQDSLHTVRSPRQAADGNRHARSASASTFNTYQQSLQGLLYLVENDQDELGRIIDELAARPSSPDPPSPNSSTGDDFATRRKRAGKLSHFFGEAGVDQDHSSPSAHKSRNELFDRMLGDVWQGAQAEARIGALRLEDLEKLGLMMGDLTRRRASLDVWAELQGH